MRAFPTYSRLIKLFAIVTFSLFASTSVHADPVIVTINVTGVATLFSGPPAVQGVANLSGPNFLANVATTNGNFGLAPCTPSFVVGCTSASLSWTSLGSDLNGSVTLNGMNFPTNAQNQLFMMFNSVTFVVPPEFLNAPAIRITAPFSFDGNFSSDDLDEGLVRLIGEGTVHLLLVRRPNFVGSTGLFLDRADYVFGSRTTSLTIEPVPEPTTIVLLLSGIAGTAMSLRRRAKRKTERN